jgi:hypothetical protein
MKTEKTNKIEEVKPYIQKFVFFAFNTFVLGFVTGQLQLWSAEPQPWQANLPGHAVAAPQPQSTTSSHST